MRRSVISPAGQKRRVVLAKTLAEDFDVLLLDEPTNHLDGEMITWLEEYLRAYRGTLIMVTHDRYFLDRVCSRILEISRGKMYGYDADYSGFLELKAARGRDGTCIRAEASECAAHGA